MTMTQLATAALRPRTLSAVGSPFTLSTGLAVWRQQTPSVRIAAGMRHESAFAPDYLNDNSIPAALRSVVPTAGVTPTNVGGGVVRAAKQAAPPRGVPR